MDFLDLTDPQKVWFWGTVGAIIHAVRNRKVSAVDGLAGALCALLVSVPITYLLAAWREWPLEPLCYATPFIAFFANYLLGGMEEVGPKAGKTIISKLLNSTIDVLSSLKSPDEGSNHSSPKS